MKQLFQIPKEWKEKQFLIQPERESITFGEIETLFSKDVQEVVHRKVVMCFCETQIPFIAGFLALEQAGAVPLMIDKNCPMEMIEELIKSYEIGWFWMPEDFDCACIEGEEWASYRGCRLIKTKDSPVRIHPELALLLTTSGSTGSKKMVRLSRTNLRSNVELLIEMAKFNPHDRGLIFLPILHCASIGFLHVLYYLGAQAVCTPAGLMSPSLTKYIDEYQITTVLSVTVGLELFRRIGFFEKEHPSLRMIAHGGGMMSDNLQSYLADYMRKRDKMLVLAYGQTECTLGISAIPQEYLDEHNHCIGVPYGNTQMWIENKDESGAGNLWVKSPCVMMGYAYGSEDLERESDTGGVVNTGDMARQDERGLFYITGRAARFAKIYGRRISLDELEAMLAGYAPEGQFVCISDDEHIHVFATVLEKREELIVYISRKTKLNHLVFQWHYIEEIPKDKTGKTMYRVLEAELSLMRL